MARGLRQGDGGAHLITFHPPGGSGSSTLVPRRALARLQHAAERPRGGVHRPLRPDPRRLRPQPIKPVLDGEPIYEDHPISFKAKELGHSIAADVRRPLYWDLFSGACGHTYGHHSVWQMWAPTSTRSTIRSCPGTRRSISPAPARCSTAAACWNRVQS